MAPDRFKALRRVTFLLLAFSALAVEIAAIDTRPIIQSLGLSAVWCAIAALVAFFMPVPAQPHQHPRFFVYLLLVGFAIAPFLSEPIRRECTGDGYPLELQMVFSLRNVGLVLAACAGWAICLRLAAIVSLFLILFASAMTNHTAVMVLLGFYTLTGGIWLMLTNLSGLSQVAVAQRQIVAIVVQARRERLPWLALSLTAGIATCAVGLIAFGPNRAVQALGEWIPTSGGTGDYDPFARGGINDGDDETRGENAKSTGMTQTDSFLESPLPSLYDVANEVYGPPFKISNTEQSIALDAISKEIASHKRTPDNLRPNREFPTRRLSPRKPNTPLSRSARAMFEIEGRTPVHVRVLAFDTFDGQDWHEAPMNLYCLVVEKEPTDNWMKVSGTKTQIYGEPETHSFKITAPEGSLIPTPPHLTRFRIGKVNRPDFFSWSHDRILKFAFRKTPSGIVVETECRTVDTRRLNDLDFVYPSPTERFDYQSLPPNLKPGIESLARAWVEGVPRGWPQIAAIVNRLRADFILDPAHNPPDSCASPLAHFLLESRCGPDYQFATAAAILLRVNGYRTRLVCGFYAHPDHYDPETRHTPVVKEDIHFWPEVMLPNGDWLVLEPTPGYEVAEPRLSLTERIKTASAELGAWAGRNAVALVLASVSLVLIWIHRRELFDAAAVQFWLWFPGRTWREQVRGVVRLLERRGRWAGKPRTSGRTVSTWLKTALPEPARHHRELGELTRMAEWASYGADLPPPWLDAEPLALCRFVLDAWTMRRWRNAASPIIGRRVRS